MYSSYGQKVVLNFSNSSLAVSNQILSEKLIQKTVGNEFKLQKQLTILSQGSRRWICDLLPRRSPCGSSLSSVLYIQFKTQLCSIFGPTSTAIFLMMETELTLEQNMKVVSLWVRFPMHQELSNLDLCRLINNQNIPNW